MSTETTVLDRMKEIESKKDKAQVLKILNVLKDLAKEVQEKKALCALYLAEVCESEKERKQVIDWINNLDDVQVSEDRAKELKDAVRQKLAGEKKKIEKELDEHPERFFTHHNWVNQLNSATAGSYAVSNAVSSLNVGGITVGNSPSGVSTLTTYA